MGEIEALSSLEKLDRRMYDVMREYAIKDMLDQNYDTMVELNRQLEMVLEDGDWGDDVKVELEGRIEILWKSWLVLGMIEKRLAIITSIKEKRQLLQYKGILMMRMDKMIDINLPIDSLLNNKELQDIRGWVDVELVCGKVKD